MSEYYVDPSNTPPGLGTAEDPWADPQDAADAVSAGDTIYAQGTFSASAATDIDTNAGTYDGGYIKLIGTNPSWEDDGTRFIIDGGGNAIDGIYANGQAYWWLKNIEIRECDGTGGINSAAANADNWILENCYIHDNDADGVNNGSYFRYLSVISSVFSANTGHGFDGSSYLNLLASLFMHNGGNGFNGGTGIMFLDGCGFHGNTGAGAYFYAFGKVSNSFFDGNGTYGAHCAYASVNMQFDGCRFTNQSGAGDIGFYIQANARARLTNCYFGNNTTDITGYYDSFGNLTLGGSDTNHGYVDPASHDFTLRSDATGRRYAIPLNADMDHHSSAGIIPADSGGGGGLAANIFRSPVFGGSA